MSETRVKLEEIAPELHKAITQDLRLSLGEKKPDDPSLEVKAVQVQASIHDIFSGDKSNPLKRNFQERLTQHRNREQFDFLQEIYNVHQDIQSGKLQPSDPDDAAAIKQVLTAIAEKYVDEKEQKNAWDMSPEEAKQAVLVESTQANISAKNLSFLAKDKRDDIELDHFAPAFTEVFREMIKDINLYTDEEAARAKVTPAQSAPELMKAGLRADFERLKNPDPSERQAKDAALTLGEYLLGQIDRSIKRLTAHNSADVKKSPAKEEAAMSRRTSFWDRGRNRSRSRSPSPIPHEKTMVDFSHLIKFVEMERAKMKKIVSTATYDGSSGAELQKRITDFNAAYNKSVQNMLTQATANSKTAASDDPRVLGHLQSALRLTNQMSDRDSPRNRIAMSPSASPAASPGETPRRLSKIEVKVADLGEDEIAQIMKDRDARDRANNRGPKR